MEGKKKYFALVLFLFLGLMIFTFANPVEEEKEFKDGNTEQSEKVNNKETNTTEDETTDEDDADEVQTNVLNNVTNQNTNNNDNTQNRVDDSLARAEAAVQLAEGTYTQEDVDAARELVNNVTDTTEKGKLEDRLTEVEAGIAVLALLEELETQVDEAENKTDMTTATTFRDTNAITEKIDALTNEDVAEVLQTRLDTVSKLLDDNAAPTVNVEAKGYQTNVTIEAEDEAGNPFKLYLTKNNGTEEEIENNTATTSEGIYTLRMVDDAFNEATVRFVVDGTDPVLKGLTNGGHYEKVLIDVEDLSEVTIKVTNMDTNTTTTVENGTELTDEATYKIEVTDEANNTTTYWVAVDKTAPTISGVTNNSIVNKSENAYIRDKFLTLVKVTIKYPNGEEKVEEFTRADFTVGAKNENFEYKYRATKEGTYTIYAEDKYGNNYSETFTIDRTAAKLVSANMYSTGDKYTEVINDKEHQVYYTTNGDTITAYIRVNEQLKAVPTITLTVGEKSYTATNVKEAFHKPEDKEAGIYRYQATVKVDEFNPVDGDVQFTVTNIKDKAGNETANVTKVTNRNIVRIDRTKAARVYSTIRSKAPEVVHENGNDRDYYHKNGTEFEYAISFNELLANVPTVTIAGREVTMKLNEEVLNNENKFLYEGTFKIAENEAELTEGTLEIKVTNVKDLAGNETTLADQTKTSNGRRVIYDKTAPKAVSTTYSPNTLTNQNVTVTIKVNEELKPVEGWTLSTDKKSISKEFTKNTKGNVVISDIAGNTVKRYYKISNIDKDAPKAVSTTYSPNTLTNGNVTVTIKVNEELKPVEGWTLSADKKSISKEFTKNTKGNVVISDLAGNTVTRYYKISNIDKDAPKAVSTTYSPNTLTNGNVTVTIKVNEELKPVEGWTLSEDKKSISKEFTKNTKGNVVISDLAGNTVTRYYKISNIDKVAAEIVLPGQEGESKNQYRILKDSYIAVDYLGANVADNVDENTTILPTKFYAYYPKATGIPSGVYTLKERVIGKDANGQDIIQRYFDTSMVGVNYEVQYEYTDEAGNETKKSMLLIVDAPYNPIIENNTIDVQYDLTLNDKPFYNDKERTEPLTINGNGKTITQEIDTAYKYTWDITGTRPMQSNMFTSANNSLVTVNDLNFAGTMYSITLGHYRSSNQGGFTTVLNNVNVINTKVASYSGGLSPAMSIYGKATLNNVNVYGTTLSELDTDPKWPVYDVIMVNNTDTTINGGKIGSIYTWPKAYLEINNAEIGTIDTQIEYRSDYTKAGLVIGENTKVEKIIIKENKAVVTIKSTAEVGTLDLCAHDESEMYLNIEPGAKIGKVIVQNGDSCKEMTYDEWYKLITTPEKFDTAMKLGGELKLINDIKVAKIVKQPATSHVVLDMNGKKLTLKDASVDPMIDMATGSSLVIKGNGTVDLEKNYYASFIAPRGDVTIENGNFLKAVGPTGTKYGSFFIGINGGKGKLIIKDGYFDGGYYKEGDEFNNSRNLLNGSWGQYVRVYGGTFVGQNPAYGDEGMAYTNPNSTSTYCQSIFFEGQSRLDTEMPSTYNVEKGTLADGRPTYKVTYTPAPQQ